MSKHPGASIPRHCILTGLRRRTRSGGQGRGEERQLGDSNIKLAGLEEGGYLTITKSMKLHVFTSLLLLEFGEVKPQLKSSLVFPQLSLFLFVSKTTILYI